ncbi:hypothetical protein HanIR_Chr14g0694331 [Helianthus annuus]|nr:hypothetical protein HanIR_Chr14g0694331 [Helianthus annuus]
MPNALAVMGRIHFARALLQNLTTSMVGMPTRILLANAAMGSSGVNTRATCSWWK